MRVVTWGTLLLAGALVVGCGSAQAPAEQAQAFQPVPGSQSASATAPTTRFAGMLPCADCAGIRTELTLHQDPTTGQPLTYELAETYLGSKSADGEKTNRTSGRWTIARGNRADPNITIYRLDGGAGANAQAARHFERVSEQELRLLDREQSRIESSLPYTLTRVPEMTFNFGSPAAAGAATSQAGAGPVAMVTDLASGWPVSLQVGQEMTARLGADRSSGHTWSIRPGSDGGVVQVTGPATYEAGQTDGRAGVTGVEVIHLKAIKPGTTTLAFDYKRPTDKTSAKSVTYPVTVQ